MPTELERRLEASLVIMVLRRQGPLHIERLAEKAGLTREQVANDLLWARTVGFDVTIEDRIVSLR